MTTQALHPTFQPYTPVMTHYTASAAVPVRPRIPGPTNSTHSCYVCEEPPADAAGTATGDPKP